MLLTDPPYGTTRNFWDVPLPLPELWEAVKWVVKPEGAVLFFAQCPYVNVPNDLSKIKMKIAFNLTRRQLICFGGAAAVGIPVYLLTRHALGGTGAMFLMIALMLPAFFMAMYERDGLPFEKVARNIIRAKFLRPGVRPYQTQNIYAPFAGKEVTLEQKPQEVKKPDAGR